MLSIGLLGTDDFLDFGSPSGIPRTPPPRFGKLQKTRKNAFGDEAKI
jgi:hypothetical protein